MNKKFTSQMKTNLEAERKDLLSKIERDKEFDIDMSRR
jgi:hypothetical protein